ncbi:MAG: hypothetical protein IJV14_01560 [Lachnospiraceae bacterium]|nr:hypothetical protein [Lachnospiraceae bacterium]
MNAKKICFIHHYEWKQSARNCYKVCTKCGKYNGLSDSPHIFQKEGCSTVCKKCGYVSKTEHTFVDVEGKCLRRCTVCGQEEEIAHHMRGRSKNGQCEQYCTRCGYTIPGHMWWVEEASCFGNRYWSSPMCKCTVCGALNPDGEHKWEKIQEGNYVNIKVCSRCGARDESEMITLEEASRRRALADAERDEAMRREDAMSEMRSVGIKC